MPDFPAGKRGKLPPKPLKGIGHLHDYLTSPLPVPPASFDYSSAVTDGFPMALNDQLGDCTIAGVIHLIQLWYAQVGQTWTYPGDETVRSTYFGLTGGQDTGLELTTVLRAWQSEGLFGTKIVGAAPLVLSDLQTAAAACYAFGGLYDGFGLPADAEQEFQDAGEWYLQPGPEPAADGHCVATAGFGTADAFPTYRAVPAQREVGWGAAYWATENFCRFYQDERYAVFPELFVEIGHGPLANVDIGALRSDWAAL